LALAVGVLLWLPQWPLVAHKGQCRHNDNAGCVPGSLVTPLQAKAAWVTDVHPATTCASKNVCVIHLKVDSRQKSHDLKYFRIIFAASEYKAFNSFSNSVGKSMSPNPFKIFKCSLKTS
jgi:hypothetical protein